MHVSPVGHVWPHAPQFFSFVCGSTQVPSHTRSSAGHATHAPFVHTSDASHWCPQLPQSRRLESIDVQSVPQSTRGAVHAHSPATHDSFTGQASPQPPQFFAFVWGSTQTPVQSRFEAGQAAHSALAHTSEGGHASPHAPQLSWLTCRFTHTPPQSFRGAGQTHVPFTQTSPPGQAWPQAPQFFAFVSGSMQAPPHTRRVAGQGAHALWAQTSSGSQALPHSPQLSWLAARFTQTPSHTARGASQWHAPSMHDSPVAHA
jgi:hypothetical protein